MALEESLHATTVRTVALNQEKNNALGWWNDNLFFYKFWEIYIVTNSKNSSFLEKEQKMLNISKLNCAYKGEPP